MEKELWWNYNEASRGFTDSKMKVQYYLWHFFGRYFFKILIDPFNGPRAAWLRLFGAKIGQGNYISPRTILVYPAALSMGNGNSIDDYVYINDTTVIGDNCQVSSFVKFVSGGHDVRSRAFDYQRKPVTVGNSVFIGANSVVLGGKIGTFAAIGANSFVLHDIGENTIAYGNPCIEHGERIPKDEFLKYRF
jgi:acetyltransferase-like isoleucine patch superfamily enzyme